jgi:lambda family phage minor tail protein L
MPKTLPANLVLEKNKVESQNVWYTLIVLDFDSQILRFTNNNEDVVFQTDTYVAFPFKLGSMTQNSSGTVPSLTLSVSNVNKTIFNYVENANGLVNSDVTLMIVNSGHLTEDYTELTMLFTIMKTSISTEWIDFTLGAPNPLMRKFPQDKYIAKYCNWQFKSVECAYADEDLSCDRTKDDCEAKGNINRFGGYPGLSENGLRVIR